jgi:HEAT repeat protein
MLEASITSEALGTLLEQLGDLKCPELVAPLERFLDSEDRHISRSVLALFRRMNHPLATEALRRVTRIVGHPLQLSSISALGHLEDRESIPDLIRLLNTYSSGVPPTTAGALANLGAREAIPALLRRFLDEGAAGKRGLLIVLSRLQAPGLAPHVLKALRSDRPDRVAEAIRAVEILHLTEALPDLIRLSQDDDLTLRPSASEALIRLGDRGEIPKFLGRSSRDLHLLNRFRQPELWERLRTTPQPRTYRGTLGQALTDLASDAGLTLEVHGGEDALKQDLPDNVLRRHGVSTLLEALESLFEPRRVSFVLEQDRLHLLPPEDAEDFWQHWGKQQNSK